MHICVLWRLYCTLQDRRRVFDEDEDDTYTLNGDEGMGTDTMEHMPPPTSRRQAPTQSSSSDDRRLPHTPHQRPAREQSEFEEEQEEDDEEAGVEEDEDYLVDLDNHRLKASSSKPHPVPRRRLPTPDDQPDD
ncbi:hypothetical protein FRC03_006619 [Tulasnella sp. 419]|nr:hypothetical protein FRC03_006619 [Tulasnella sp. 419]